MPKPKPTVSTGPLHFEDLEPHGFEDLVRRLLYDFRPWQQLQATGRSGADEGFDARGVEAGPAANIDPETDQDETASVIANQAERIWLIQCKRAKSITPKKLKSFLDEIPEAERERLYGIVFVAACDFSKSAQDAFRSSILSMGLSEGYLWGRGELEDMLYQPKFDDVLFTFFGISRRIRQASAAYLVRRRLAMKRKAKRLLGKTWGAEVLLRDASDDRYPYVEDEAAHMAKGQQRWCVYRCDDCHHDGLHLLRTRCLAMIADDGVAWDYAEAMNDASPHDNPWRSEQDHKKLDAYSSARTEAMAIWDAFPEGNKAWYEEWFVLPFEHIIDIDEDGDEWFRGAHIYIEQFDARVGPFRKYLRLKLETIGQWGSRSADPNATTRTQTFKRSEG